MSDSAIATFSQATRPRFDSLYTLITRSPPSRQICPSHFHFSVSPFFAHDAREYLRSDLTEGIAPCVLHMRARNLIMGAMHPSVPVQPRSYCSHSPTTLAGCYGADCPEVSRIYFWHVSSIVISLVQSRLFKPCRMYTLLPQQSYNMQCYVIKRMELLARLLH
jgi:hypothetical protein